MACGSGDSSAALRDTASAGTQHHRHHATAPVAGAVPLATGARPNAACRLPTAVTFMQSARPCAGRSGTRAARPPAPASARSAASRAAAPPPSPARRHSTAAARRAGARPRPRVDGSRAPRQTTRTRSCGTRATQGGGQCWAGRLAAGLPGARCAPAREEGVPTHAAAVHGERRMRRTPHTAGCPGQRGLPASEPAGRPSLQAAEPPRHLWIVAKRLFVVCVPAHIMRPVLVQVCQA